VLLPAVQMAQDMAAAVPASATTWGWKHPYALFTLNHIYQVRGVVGQAYGCFAAAVRMTQARLLLVSLSSARFACLGKVLAAGVGTQKIHTGNRSNLV
jgi:hypothetical protein